MKTRGLLLYAELNSESVVRDADPSRILKQLVAWHEEAGARSERWLSLVYQSNGKAQMFVGVGDRRGLYLNCNYGQERWDWDLIAVGPKGLRGRRQAVEFIYSGNPHEVLVQCLVPVEAALGAVEFFLKCGGLPLDLLWVSEKGLVDRR